MSCDERFRTLISGMIDNELSPSEQDQAAAHLAGCEQCRRLYAELKGQQEAIEMVFAREHDRALDDFENSVYARLERRIGWMLLSLGAILLGVAGGIALVRELILNPSMPLLVRIGVPLGIGGVVVLGVAVLRQRLSTLRGDPYKEIKR